MEAMETILHANAFLVVNARGGGVLFLRSIEISHGVRPQNINNDHQVPSNIAVVLPTIAVTFPKCEYLRVEIDHRGMRGSSHRSINQCDRLLCWDGFSAHAGCRLHHARLYIG